MLPLESTSHSWPTGLLTSGVPQWVKGFDIMISTSRIMAAALNHFNNGSVEQNPFKLYVICHSQNVVYWSDWIPFLPFLCLFLSLTECPEHMEADQMVRLKNWAKCTSTHMVQIRQAVPPNCHNPGQAVIVSRELWSLPVRQCAQKGYLPVPFLRTPRRVGSLNCCLISPHPLSASHLESCIE